MSDLDTAQVRAIHDAWECDACSAPIVRCWLMTTLDALDEARKALSYSVHKDEWYRQQQRAEKAEAERDTLRFEVKLLQVALRNVLAAAEAKLAAVRAVLDDVTKPESDRPINLADFDHGVDVTKNLIELALGEGQ